MADEIRKHLILDFEAEAELLFVQQLDLLSQMEAQLRAVHHTMHRISRLRRSQQRSGPELANGERETILGGLARELDEVDEYVAIEHQCCVAMQQTITTMREVVTALKRHAAQLNHDESASSASDDMEPPS
jgi:hypothetical protein